MDTIAIGMIIVVVGALAFLADHTRRPPQIIALQFEEPAQGGSTCLVTLAIAILIVLLIASLPS
jgi:hypothetical protein